MFPWGPGRLDLAYSWGLGVHVVDDDLGFSPGMVRPDKGELGC